MVPVNILKDKVIADATETAVFQHSDPKKLVLVSSEALYEAKYNNDPNLEVYMPDHIVRLIPKYNVYKRRPDLFPHVYHIEKDHVIVEKLDVLSVAHDVEILESYLGDDFYSFEHMVNNFYKKILKLNWPTEVRELARKYANIVCDLKSTLTKKEKLEMDRVDDLYDVHEENWGYDSKGNLKLIDF